MEISLAPFGALVYTLPAAAIIFFSREAVRNSLFRKIAPEETPPAFYFVDILGLFLAAYASVSWGGLVQKNRRDNLLTFLASQLWLLLILIVSMLYLNINHPPVGSYTHNFFYATAQISELMLYLNFIPFPGLDASFFYTQNKFGIYAGYLGKTIILICLLQNYLPIHPKNFAWLTARFAG